MFGGGRESIDGGGKVRGPGGNAEGSGGVIRVTAEGLGPPGTRRIDRDNIPGGDACPLQRQKYFAKRHLRLGAGDDLKACLGGSYCNRAANDDGYTLR